MEGFQSLSTKTSLEAPMTAHAHQSSSSEGSERLRTVQSRSSTLTRQQEDDCISRQYNEREKRRGGYVQLFLTGPLLNPSTIAILSPAGVVLNQPPHQPLSLPLIMKADSPVQTTERVLESLAVLPNNIEGRSEVGNDDNLLVPCRVESFEERS